VENLDTRIERLYDAGMRPGSIHSQGGVPLVVLPRIPAPVIHVSAAHADPRQKWASEPTGGQPVVSPVEPALEDALAHLELVRESLAEQAVRDEIPYLDESELLERLERYEAGERAAQAGKSAVLAELAERSRAGDRVGDRVGVVLGIRGQSADRRLDEAVRANRVHPLLVDVHAAGLVSSAGVSALLDVVSGLDEAATRQVIGAVLDRLGRTAVPRSLPARAGSASRREHQARRRALAARPLSRMSREDLAGIDREERARMRAHATPGQLRRWATLELARLDPDSVREKADGDQTSYVELGPSGADGKSVLGLYTDAAINLAAFTRIDTVARHRQAELKGEARASGDKTAVAPLDVLRAQVMSDLLLGRLTPEEQALAGWDSSHPDATGSRVNLTVLLDRDGAPTLPRYGLASPEVLVGLVELSRTSGGRTTVRVVEEVPCPGEHVSRGHEDPYEPPEALSRWIRVRDQTCRFPGCVRPAQTCEQDHTIPWPNGPTCACNLSSLCKRHHLFKHHPNGWTLTNHETGRLTWHAPGGLEFPVEPDT